MTTRRGLALFGIALGSSSLGFLAGVLSAPRSGRESRRRLARRIDDEADDLRRRGRRAISDVADSLNHSLEEGKRAIASAVQR